MLGTQLIGKTGPHVIEIFRIVCLKTGTQRVCHKLMENCIQSNGIKSKHFFFYKEQNFEKIINQINSFAMQFYWCITLKLGYFLQARNLMINQAKNWSIAVINQPIYMSKGFYRIKYNLTNKAVDENKK